MTLTRRIVFVLFAVVFASCVAHPRKKNQEQPLVSPSGRYVLTVPIETAADSRRRYWRVTISDVNGNVLFKDDSEFVGHLNVYWAWDDRDRVWLKNSDDGRIHYWELDDKNSWRRYEWTEASPVRPPASLPVKLSNSSLGPVNGVANNLDRIISKSLQ